MICHFFCHSTTPAITIRRHIQQYSSGLNENFGQQPKHTKYLVSSPSEQQLNKYHEQLCLVCTQKGLHYTYFLNSSTYLLLWCGIRATDRCKPNKINVFRLPRIILPLTPHLSLFILVNFRCHMPLLVVSIFIFKFFILLAFAPP